MTRLDGGDPPSLRIGHVVYNPAGCNLLKPVTIDTRPFAWVLPLSYIPLIG
jgi:hypothetical protein